MREPLTWVVKEGTGPWSVNHQDGQALADYLNALERQARRVPVLVKALEKIAALEKETGSINAYSLVEIASAALIDAEVNDD